jgi:hypothetical protein
MMGVGTRIRGWTTGRERTNRRRARMRMILKERMRSFDEVCMVSRLHRIVS